MLKYVPNTLTISRLILIPFIILNIFAGNYITAFVLFTISGVTDIADGFIARKFNLVSNLGKLLDPLADKLTQIATLASLTIKDIIPVWILLIVVGKEFVMIVASAFLYGKDFVVYSKWYGKLATSLLYLAIVCSLLLKQYDIGGIWTNVSLAIYCLALISTIFALVMYAITLFKKGPLDKEFLKKEIAGKEKKKSS